MNTRHIISHLQQQISTRQFYQRYPVLKKLWLLTAMAVFTGLVSSGALAPCALGIARGMHISLVSGYVLADLIAAVVLFAGPRLLQILLPPLYKGVTGVATFAGLLLSGGLSGLKLGTKELCHRVLMACLKTPQQNVVPRERYIDFQTFAPSTADILAVINRNEGRQVEEKIPHPPTELPAITLVPAAVVPPAECKVELLDFEEFQRRKRVP